MRQNQALDTERRTARFDNGKMLGRRPVNATVIRLKPNPKRRKHYMQISISRVLSHVALSALCIAGMVSGPPITWAGVAVVATLLVAYAINAAVATNGTRRFAIGVLIPVCMYLALTMYASENEYAAQGGRLPTTRIAQSILQSRYSGKTMSIGKFSDTLGGVRDTLPLVHLSVALILGYTGGFYATWISRRHHPDGG